MGLDLGQRHVLGRGKGNMGIKGITDESKMQHYCHVPERQIKPKIYDVKHVSRRICRLALTANSILMAQSYLCLAKEGYAGLRGISQDAESERHVLMGNYGS